MQAASLFMSSMICFSSFSVPFADELVIAEKTVKVHRGRVMQKMEVNSVAGLVHLCETAGLPPRKLSAR